MKQDLEHFIHERAENLALVYLTRSQDLRIERISSDYKFDLLVTIQRENVPTGRIFGVQIKGQDQALKTRQAGTSLRLSQQEKSYFQDLPFPVCALLFTMEDDKGYYQWLKYSTQSNQNLPFEQNQWCSLDTYSIDQLIETVNAWYDEKNHSAA